MTQQQAKALVARLSAVWVPKTSRYAMGGQQVFRWVGLNRREWNISACKVEHLENLVFYLDCPDESNIFRHVLACRGDTGQIFPRYDGWMKNHIDSHLEMFRRGCFLSGCPIEASAHEQIEWMKWFEERQLELNSLGGNSVILPIRPEQISYCDKLEVES